MATPSPTPTPTPTPSPSTKTTVSKFKVAHSVELIMAQALGHLSSVQTLQSTFNSIQDVMDASLDPTIWSEEVDQTALINMNDTLTDLIAAGDSLEVSLQAEIDNTDSAQAEALNGLTLADYEDYIEKFQLFIQAYAYIFPGDNANASSTDPTDTSPGSWNGMTNDDKNRVTSITNFLFNGINRASQGFAVPVQNKSKNTGTRLEAPRGTLQDNEVTDLDNLAQIMSVVQSNYQQQYTRFLANGQLLLASTGNTVADTLADSTTGASSLYNTLSQFKSDIQAMNGDLSSQA